MEMDDSKQTMWRMVQDGRLYLPHLSMHWLPSFQTSPIALTLLRLLGVSSPLVSGRSGLNLIMCMGISEYPTQSGPVVASPLLIGQHHARKHALNGSGTLREELWKPLSRDWSG